MTYLEWVVDKRKKHGTLSERNYSGPVLLLPLLSETGTPEKGKGYMYAAITDQWTKMADK